MKILFMSDLLPYYKKIFSEELKKVGIKNFELSDNYSETDTDVEFIIYSPIMLGGKILKRDFSKFKKLKAVLSLYAGIEDVINNKTLNCPLIKMIDKDGLTNSMVEWCLAHTLRFHLGIDRYIYGQDGIWRHKIKPPTAKDRTIGILGLGELGKSVALLLSQLGFNIYGWSRTKKKIKGVNCLVGCAGLKQTLRKSEILILLLPLTDDTKFILNEKNLSLLPKKSQLINAGRGELIDDRALIRKLRSGHIQNATLDVFQKEPLPKEHPYWSLPNVTVTPHIAADTPILSSSKVLAHNIKDLTENRLPAGVVDVDRGY